MNPIRTITFASLMLIAAFAQAQVVTNTMPAGSSPDDSLWRSARESDLPKNRPSVRYYGSSALSPSAQVALMTTARRIEPAKGEPTLADPRIVSVASLKREPTLADPKLITISNKGGELPLQNIQQVTALQPVPATAPAYRARPLFPRVRGLIPQKTTPTTPAYVLPNTVYSAPAAQQVYANPNVQQVAGVAYDPCTCQPIQCQPQCQPVQGATYTTAQTVLMPQANQCYTAPQQPVQLQAVPATAAPQLGQTVVPAQVAAAYPTTRQRIGPLIPLRREIPEGTFIGQGILGQPAAFVDGQPVRNFIRYLTL